MTLFRYRNTIPDMMKMYSVTEAAEKLGISTRRVRVLLTEGRLEGKKLGHDWVVLSLDYRRKRKVKAKKGGSDGKS